MKVALCMRGAVAKKSGAFFKQNDLYVNSHYVDYKKCYNSIKKHIIDVNNNYQFDVFCHCWNYDLEDEIKSLYNPVKYNFEDNRKYNDEINSLCKSSNEFGGISQSLTMKKSIELKEEYEREENIKYDIVILYRYDVLLWKDMNLNEYTNLNDIIYVNAHHDGNGDFHFVMNHDTAYDFKNLYDSLYLGNVYGMHHWIKNYVLNFMKKQLVMDNIVPGRDQEVIRKIRFK
jgi:hypothetical protein